MNTPASSSPPLLLSFSPPLLLSSFCRVVARCSPLSTGSGACAFHLPRSTSGLPRGHELAQARGTPHARAQRALEVPNGRSTLVRRLERPQNSPKTHLFLRHTPRSKRARGVRTRLNGVHTVPSGRPGGRAPRDLARGSRVRVPCWRRALQGLAPAICKLVSKTEDQKHRTNKPAEEERQCVQIVFMSLFSLSLTVSV